MFILYSLTNPSSPTFHNNRASDPTIFTYPESSQITYLIWSGRDTNDDLSLNIYIARLTAPLTVTSSRIEISQADYAWEKHGGGVYHILSLLEEVWEGAMWK